MFKRFTNACVRVVNRWLPDAFLFAVILTFVVTFALTYVMIRKDASIQNEIGG